MTKLGNGSHGIEFLVGTGATFSVLNIQLEEIDPGRSINVVGATGQPQEVSFMKPLSFKLGKSVGMHQFLYMPQAPKSLIGRDLLEKLQAEIKFTEGIQLKVNEKELIEILSLALLTDKESEEIPDEILNQVYPGVWAGGTPGTAETAQLVTVKLKPGVRPVQIKQYPLKLEDCKGMKTVIDNFLKFVLLIECESEYDTPILPMQKPDGKSYID